MKHILIAMAALIWIAAAWAQVANTKHNLSVSGPGSIKAASETQICIFCHTPHNASPSAPLWNRADPGGIAYVPYSSSTSLAGAGQPNGASLLCLSCHDGTIALGNVLSRSTPIAMAGGATFMPPTSQSYIGTDLRDDHPVSFVYSALLAAFRGELVDPSTLTGPVKLDVSGQLQCTSCHDPHNNQFGMFLVMQNQASALCTTCHVKNFWAQTSHRLSNATWNGVQPNPWPHSSGKTVASNACENCHRPHTAGGRSWLLNFGEASGGGEEDNCTACHNGNVARKDVQSEFFKLPSHHPVERTVGVHDPKEPAVVQDRHVECSDCHNPHANNGSTGGLPGSLNGVRGVDLNGVEVAQIAYDYQLCFRCHADSPSQKPRSTTRQIQDLNLRLQMASGSPSYHPVLATGVNKNVPDLLSGWSVTSTMKCGDCHNNDAGPGAGGTGPRGPHGSNNPSLLERSYLTGGTGVESPNNYALCYKCHDRNRFITSRPTAAFFAGDTGHARHVVTQNTPCNVCHDPHGVSATQGKAENNSYLINFDISVVSPVTINGVPTLKFEVIGAPGSGSGRCYLNCHGQAHTPKSY